MALHRLGYARVSSQDQNLERQLYLFDQVGIDELFVEKVSGGRRDRPEFLRLVDRAMELRGQGHGCEIVVLDLTRWARDISYAIDTLERLEQAGVRVREGSGEPITVATATGFLDVGVKSLFSHYFRLNLSDQGKKTYRRKHDQGKPHSGRVTLGYAKAPDQSALVPGPTWGIAREVVDKFLAGEALLDISRWLWTEHGIKRSHSGLNQWLRSPAIRGHLYYPKTGAVLYNKHPALITEQEYQAILQRIDTNRQLRGINKSGRVYPVPPIVFCAHCGQRCNYSRSSKRYFFCYERKFGRCSAPARYCREDWVEAAIQEAIVDAAELVAAAALSNDAPDPRIVALQAEADALRPLAHRAGIAAEVAAIEAEIAQLKAAQGNQAAGVVELREALVDIAFADWGQLSPEQRRELYQRFVERVTVDGGEVVEVRVRGVG